MTAVFTKIRVGEPTRHKALSVFPLFTESNGGVEYRLADEAIADRSLLVEEVSEGGSVPELSVENKGLKRVLFIEGEELIGAKQNRILNTSLLVAAQSKVKIPVSCVEQGRWAYRSREFKPSGKGSPHKLRHVLKGAVGGSAKAGRGHRSDQGKVWQEVQNVFFAHCLEPSPTDAMAEAFDALREKSAAYQKNAKYVEGATGVAVGIGRRIVALDVFDKPATCQRAWDRLLSGLILDALESKSEDYLIEVAEVEQLIDAARAADWQSVKPVGEGEEYRAEFNKDHASVLSYDDTLVHGSVIAHA